MPTFGCVGANSVCVSLVLRLDDCEHQLRNGWISEVLVASSAPAGLCRLGLADVRLLCLLGRLYRCQTGAQGNMKHIPSRRVVWLSSCSRIYVLCCSVAHHPRMHRGVLAFSCQPPCSLRLFSPTRPPFHVPFASAPAFCCISVARVRSLPPSARYERSCFFFRR